MATTLYLVSVVLANLVISTYGPPATIPTALLLIGATITVRDKLHEEWRGSHLVLRMGLLIGVAGLISAVLSLGAALRIAVASVTAFIVSESIDAVAYHYLRSRPWLVKANGSNVLSAAVDSIVFPTLAFGSFMPLIVLGQFVAKVLGGALWSLLVRRLGWVAVVLLCSTPVNAQSLSLNGAWIHNPYVSAAAAEIFVSAPPVVGLRPYAIVSWNTSSDWDEPTIIARVGYSHRIGPVIAGLGAGVISLPGLRTPHPSLGGMVMGPSVGRFRPYVVAAYEKTPDWTWTTFAGVSCSLWFRK